MKILLEVFKAHLVLVDLGILETVFDFGQGDLAAHSLEHPHHVLGHQVALPAYPHKYLSLSSWKKRYSSSSSTRSGWVARCRALSKSSRLKEAAIGGRGLASLQTALKACLTFSPETSEFPPRQFIISLTSFSETLIIQNSNRQLRRVYSRLFSPILIPFSPPWLFSPPSTSLSPSTLLPSLPPLIEGLAAVYPLGLIIIFKLMNQYQIGKLKKELQRKQEQLKQQREDHQHTQQRLVQLQTERDRFYSELVVNRQTIEQVETLMSQKMKEIKTKLEQQNSDSIAQLQGFKDKLTQEEILRERLAEEIRNKDTVISDLALRLRQMSRKYKDPSLLVNVKDIGEQAAVSNQNLYKLTDKYNKACTDIENLLAENKILRKLHGVPENFGFDLQDIKVAEKQELEDYKAQCRKLETEIEELEEERTQLRYRLRQFNTLFSNKGERYKDMTPQQLDMLDQYALNLKEGRVELPAIDKTHKEMEREIIKLKGQIEILQNKQSPLIAKPLNEQQSERVSVEALKRFEEQITKMINPLRDDVRRITETGLRGYDGDKGSVLPGKGVVNIEGGSQFKPPMPLPVSHNDWSNIKEGFSYLYSSKIPIDLKDIQDEGGFSLLKAKYEVSALQLQNIQSLKLLKQKQLIQSKLSKELNDLKAKYQKCLKVQDQLFLKYFRQKQESEAKSRRLEVEKSNLSNEKDQVQVSLDIMTQSFNALSKRTDVEKRCGELTSRLAITEAELLKITRKYDVLADEHKMLRGSYSGLESKTAASEFGLKQKLSQSRKNQKELVFFLNKVLEESRDSVSSEAHRTTLAKLQNISDQSLSNSIRQTELRVKINQLQNIQREINLKDDVIETLRDDNFDIILQSEILKNRLEATDPTYRTFQNVFRRLVGFINHNNISLLTYFKKFDRDGSGELSKNQFISALRALGFDVSNDQFDLLFNEFDLDGSQSVTYHEFLRKMRRSGVYTRNSEEESLYRLFKAIKQANITVRKAFQIIDMDGSNEVSKTEMDSAFRKIGIDITPSTIDWIFKMCDDDNSGTISCTEFQKLFDDLIRESAIEEKEVFSAELDWKLAFVLKMQEVSQKYHAGGLKQTFKSLDVDGNSCLTLNQFTEFFSKVGIELAKKDLLELFNFLDRHRDGKIEFFQFLKVLEEARLQKKRADRLKYIKCRVEQLRKENQGELSKDLDKKAGEEKAMSIKLLSLQSKHSSLLKKNEKLIKSLALKETEARDLKMEVQQLQKNVEKIRDEYYKQKQSSIKNEEALRGRISQTKSKELMDQHRKHLVRMQEIDNDLQLYKNLYQDLSTKNRYDEMRIVKVESEVEKSYQLVKDLQSISDSNAELGKKIYELEISKRNEEIINKKYEESMDEVRASREISSQLKEEAMEREREVVQAHFLFQEKSKIMQQAIDQLHGQILPTLDPQKVQDILAKIRQISRSKTQLQTQHKQIKELLFNLQVRNDYLQNQKAAVDELQQTLKRTYTDQSSVTIMELTNKLSEYRMGELKARREASLLKEKEDYYMRVNNTHIENAKELEAELASWETKHNQREEFWRKRLSEQVKLMEDLQKQASKSRQEQKTAEMFLKGKAAEEQQLEQKYEALPQEKQMKIASFVRRSSAGGNQNIVFELKAKIKDLENELVEKEKEIYQLRTSFKELVPEARISDFGGQMSASTTNFLMQTELTTSQLKNNARRFINNQKDQQQYYQQEAMKMTQAAQQSIDTLQAIIDDKNQQISRKDSLIDSLRKQLMRNKEEDTRMIQTLNMQIRQLKTRQQTGSVNQIMNRPTSKNFYKGEDNSEVSKLLARKEEEMRILQDKYDRLYISKDKKSNQQVAAGQRSLERKIEDINMAREREKKEFEENEGKLTLKIKNLQKLSKQKDVKLNKLQKTLIDLKNLAVNEGTKMEGQSSDIEKQLKEEILNMTKGKTANDSRMEITMQRSLQALQEMNKKNKDYEIELKRLKEQKFSKTTAFKK